MPTNQDAYNKLRTAAASAIAGYAQATTPAAAQELMTSYLAFDDELDALIAQNLQKDAGQYKVLTQDLTNAKTTIENVQENAKQFLDATTMAANLASAFAGVLAFL